MSALHCRAYLFRFPFLPCDILVLAVHLPEHAGVATKHSHRQGRKPCPRPCLVSLIPSGAILYILVVLPIVIVVAV